MNLSIRNLRKYDHNGILILDAARLTIPSGSITALVGNDRTGVLMLLHLIAGMMQKSEGEILYNGSDVIPKDRISVVLQESDLDMLTVRENIAQPLRLRKSPRQIVDSRVHSLAAELKLTPYLDRQIDQIPSGAVQKTVLARALSSEPELLLMDAESACSDPGTSDEIEKVLRRMNREQGLTVIMAMHDPGQARQIAHDIVLMEQGRVVEHCETERFFTEPSEIETRKYIRKKYIL